MGAGSTALRQHVPSRSTALAKMGFVAEGPSSQYLCSKYHTFQGFGEQKPLTLCAWTVWLTDLQMVQCHVGVKKHTHFDNCRIRRLLRKWVLKAYPSNVGQDYAYASFRTNATIARSRNLQQMGTQEAYEIGAEEVEGQFLNKPHRIARGEALS